MSSDPPESDDEILRVLISELARFEEAGDDDAVARIYNELRDVISRRVSLRSTIRPVPT